MPREFIKKKSAGLSLKYAYRLNKDADPTKRTKEELDLEKEYQKVLKEAESEKRVAEGRAKIARDEAIETLKAEIKLREDLFEITKLEMELTEKSIGVFSNFREEGVSDVMSELIKSDKQTNVN